MGAISEWSTGYGETLVTDQFRELTAGQFYRSHNELLVGNPASVPACERLLVARHLHAA